MEKECIFKKLNVIIMLSPRKDCGVMWCFKRWIYSVSGDQIWLAASLHCSSSQQQYALINLESLWILPIWWNQAATNNAARELARYKADKKQRKEPAENSVSRHLPGQMRVSTSYPFIQVLNVFFFMGSPERSPSSSFITVSRLFCLSLKLSELMRELLGGIRGMGLVF